MTTIYLIRHGQASFGAADYDKLSEMGHEQSRVVGQALSQRLPPDGHCVVFAGDMRRHRETAAACLATLQRELEPTIDAGFNEFDHEEVIVRHEPRFADRDAMQKLMRVHPDPHRAFQQMFELAIARWTGGEFDSDYRESWPGFRARCRVALDAVAARTPRDATALVFTSGGTISALCQTLLQLTDASAFALNFRLANAGMTKLAIGARGLSVVSLNEHGHLEAGGGKLLTFR